MNTRKLSDEQILAIFNHSEYIPQKLLAKRFGVSVPLISNIKTGAMHSDITHKVYVPKAIMSDESRKDLITEIRELRANNPFLDGDLEKKVELETKFKITRHELNRAYNKTK